MFKPGIDRYVIAQEQNYEIALQEIRSGCKKGHWMWYIFPQIAGLGHSFIARYYAIYDKDEAIEFLNHPILRGNLEEITGELLKLDSSDALSILGYPDNKKLQSCMTLFFLVSGDLIYKRVLDKFFDAEFDDFTKKALEQGD